jgi:hypothetical protein
MAQAAASPPATAEGGDVDLAKQLNNPVAHLISVPLQNNYDCCYGPAHGYRYTLNIQPVIPVTLSANWSLIVRTITPLISQGPTVQGGPTAFGLSDTTQSFFLSPATVKGFTWAIGPALLWPTATADALKSNKWGAGPTFLALQQTGGATYGLLANHIWSYAGPGARDISATFLQPFFNYTFPSTTGVSVNLESSYDWTTKQWTVPLNVGVSHLYTVDKQRVSLGVFGRYYLATPTDGPGWGLRFVATLLFPKA